MEPQEQPRAFPVVLKIVAQAESVAGQVADPLAELVRAIETAMRGTADPYVLLGVFVEGIARTVGTIPPCRQSTALLATFAMLQERGMANIAMRDARG